MQIQTSPPPVTLVEYSSFDGLGQGRHRQLFHLMVTNEGSAHVHRNDQRVFFAVKLLTASPYLARSERGNPL